MTRPRRKADSSEHVAAAGAANLLATAGTALNDRAKYRLRLAAVFLRDAGVRLDGPREHFYDDCQREIERLDAATRAQIKELVDWIEAFDPNDALAKSPTRDRQR